MAQEKMTAGQKAAATRKRRLAGKKAAVARKRKAAGKKAAETRQRNKQSRFVSKPRLLITSGHYWVQPGQAFITVAASDAHNLEITLRANGIDTSRDDGIGVEGEDVAILMLAESADLNEVRRLLRSWKGS